MTTITVTGIRTTRCSVASGQWFTELETADGVIVDPFVLAVDVPLSDDAQAECQEETELARQTVTRAFLQLPLLQHLFVFTPSGMPA